MGGERSTYLADDQKYAIVRNNGDCHLGNPGVVGGKSWQHRCHLSTTPLKHVEEQKYSSKHA
jgi:hypothetical protein